jgi:hypothetical protein
VTRSISPLTRRLAGVAAALLLALGVYAPSASASSPSTPFTEAVPSSAGLPGSATQQQDFSYNAASINGVFAEYLLGVRGLSDHDVSVTRGETGSAAFDDWIRSGAVADFAVTVHNDAGTMLFRFAGAKVTSVANVIPGGFQEVTISYTFLAVNQG